jgi:hypothetical protein
MKGHTKIIAFLALSCLGELAYSYSEGPPLGSTGVPAGGGFLAESTCHQCHNDSPVNPLPSGGIELLGVPARYIPGHTYALRLTVIDPVAIRWGFQVTAVTLVDFRGAGTLSPLPNDLMTQVLSGGPGGRSYIEQGAVARATGFNHRDRFSWRFQWIAPSSDRGTIAFYGAGNAANGDGTDMGDHIYSRSPQPLAISKG